MKLKLIFLLLLSKSAFAQWNVGISVMPVSLMPVTNTSVFTPKNGSSYFISISTSYEANEHIIFESGLTYSYKKVIWADDIPDTKVSWDDSGSVRPDYTKMELIRWTEIYSSITLPFIVNYKITLNSSSAFLLGGGIQFGYLYKRLNEFHSTTGRVDTWGNNNVQFIGGTFINLEYQSMISKSVGVSLSSQYSYDIYPKEGNLELSFHSVGLGVGLIIKMN